MSRPPADPSERMLTSDATDFERRMLEAARERRPSAAASERMARALGLTAAAAGASAATAATRAAQAAAAKATAAGTTAVWPWVSVGVIGLAVAGAVIGARAARQAPPHAAAPAVTAPAPVAEPALPPRPPAPAKHVAIAAAAPSARPSAATSPGDLGAEVALIDVARDAIAAGAGRRALETVRRYQEKYPSGTFRPEAGAIRIEALMKLGRDAEARALAERFILEHRGSLLARRVADVVGLGER